MLDDVKRVSRNPIALFDAIYEAGAGNDVKAFVIGWIRFRLKDKRSSAPTRSAARNGTARKWIRRKASASSTAGRTGPSTTAITAMGGRAACEALTEPHRCKKQKIKLAG